MRLAVAVVILCLAPAARADDKPAAREAFAEGTRYYDIADFGRALEAFKRAYVSYEEPSFLFNIAQSHRRLGNQVEDSVSGGGSPKVVCCR
jgi:hypothetical protein